ncbi:unnamed protein product [Hymenolepis diminuta]|uniref:SHSP domain-containing protein n=1 Tax=Hymenolepis diminuta TaxID=6216 RepID=A0A0R3SIP1_HYMDI|nr:unnamed protein product [Hymenolepis diminuta]
MQKILRNLLKFCCCCCQQVEELSPDFVVRYDVNEERVMVEVQKLDKPEQKEDPYSPTIPLPSKILDVDP